MASSALRSGVKEQARKFYDRRVQKKQLANASEAEAARAKDDIGRDCAIVEARTHRHSFCASQMQFPALAAFLEQPAPPPIGAASVAARRDRRSHPDCRKLFVCLKFAQKKETALELNPRKHLNR